MKKNFYLLMILTVFIFSGCSKPDQMANYIPTLIPENPDGGTGDNLVSVEDGSQEASEEEAEVTEAPKALHVGQTTVMYVRLDKYGAYLNVRPNPSTDGEPVGFLVHAEKVDVIEIVDGWAKIVYNDTISYVKSSYLVKERPEYLVPPTPTPMPVNTPTPIPDPNQAPPEI